MDGVEYKTSVALSTQCIHVVEVGLGAYFCTFSTCQIMESIVNFNYGPNVTESPIFQTLSLDYCNLAGYIVVAYLYVHS